MKLAIYIEEKTTQIVLSPETVFEKEVLTKCGDISEARLFHGSFYDSRGGWVRQEAYTGSVSAAEPVSLILRFSPPEVKS